MSLTKKNTCEQFELETKKYYSIKRIYNKDQELSMIQVLNRRGRITKCLFYDENKRLSNLAIYNPDTGKEVKNITYRADGKTISSVREFDFDTSVLIKVQFYKPDGRKISSIVEYNKYGQECKFTFYSDNGEVITGEL